MNVGMTRYFNIRQLAFNSNNHLSHTPEPQETAKRNSRFPQQLVLLRSLAPRIAVEAE